MVEIAPFGSWRSPVTIELMTGRTVGLSALSSDGDALLWLESRPQEAGRTTLMRWRAETGIEEMTTAPRDVGSRVHEYGGGAYAAREGWIVFSDRKTGGVHLITPDGACHPIASGDKCRYADFAWDMARGRVLAVREDHRGDTNGEPRAAIVALSLAPASEPEFGEVVVSDPDFLAAPVPSPDGRRLAWLEWNHPNMPWDATRLNVAEFSVDGSIGTPSVVAGLEAEAILQPVWLDAQRLMFSGDRSGWWNLYVWDGRAVSAVAPIDAEIGGPAWNFGPRHFTVLDSERTICAITRDGAREAYLLAHGQYTPLPLGPVPQAPIAIGTGIATITSPRDRPPAIVRFASPEADRGETLRHAGPQVLSAEDCSMAESFDFPAADGEPGHALYYPPRNRAWQAPAGTLPPLVTLVHGGPTAMAGDSFSLAIQWWTSRGFAVCDVNYRGSSGFGRRYRNRLRGAWGIADVEDCIAAAQHLAATGRADPARMAIRGGSAGGFTVLAALTMSDVFGAGASHYGVADLALLARDTHKFESRYLDSLIGRLPEDEAIFRARSPLYRIDRLKAPVILFQGLDDRVVPPNQAEAMVEAIRQRNGRVAYYAFEGEAHGFRRAETIRRVLELELSFYGQVFGFEPDGLSERAQFVQ